MKRVFKRRSTGTVAAMFVLHSVTAQTAPPAGRPANLDDDIQTLEAFVTTGSNIRRLEQEKTLPVTVFSEKQIEARDAATPMDLLIGIPQVTNLPANETSTNAVAARGDNANVALRGLGAENTLLLINGRRMPFHPFNTSAVNVNTLPTSGLQQIEVLRDGASAVYGSDAVAGVINYVTTKAADGTEASVRFGVTEHGGGMDIQGTLRHGVTFAKGRGSWVMTLSAYNRDAIYWRERAWSSRSDKTASARPPWNVAGSAYDGRTATGVWPSFRLGPATQVNYFYPVDAAPTLTATALPQSLYADYNQYTTGQPMSARWNLFQRIEYELRNGSKAFAEISGYISKSQTGRQPITLSSSDAVVTLSADNPYNPYGTRFYSATGAPNADGTSRLTGNPQTLTIAAMLLADGGPEKIEATDRMYRVLGGFNGKLGTSSWNWETAAMLGAVRVTDFAVNSVRHSKLREVAARTDATAWNPFGHTFKLDSGRVVVDQPYKNPEDVWRYYTQSANRYGHSRIASGDGRMSGHVHNLWAGPITTSFGLEWRYEMKEDRKDPFVSFNPPGSGLDENDNDILVMSPKADYSASRSIASGYVETVLPLAAPQNKIHFLMSLTATASVRFERYSDFGNATKPKFGLNWKPFPEVMVRSSLNRGFRAPDLASLYQPPAFTVASPPGTRDLVRNNFFTGVGLPAESEVLTKTHTLSNPNLQPEHSTGISIGVAVDVPKIRGLSFTVDYWEIEQDNLIITKGRDTARDEQLVRAYTQTQLAAGRSINDIATGSHVAPDAPNTYIGDPNTLRAPVTDVDRMAFAAANARLPPSEWMAPLGTIVGSISQSINSEGRNFTNGFDFSVSYTLPRTSLGQFLCTTEWSHFLNKFTKDTPTAPKDDEIIAMVLPAWKSSTTLQWRKGPWSSTLNATYTSDSRTGANTNAATYAALDYPDYIREFYNDGTINYYEVGEPALQINVGLGYRFRGDVNHWIRATSFRIGVNNLLDEEPVRTATPAGYSGTTGSSLWVGRAYTLTVNRTF